MYDAKYRQENAAARKVADKQWRLGNPEKLNAYAANRRAVKKNATPKWANLNKIHEFYLLAAKMTKETGRQYHVDHIVPLNGVTVSGLHCEFNLQVIPAIENIRKGNRWPL